MVDEKAEESDVVKVERGKSRVDDVGSSNLACELAGGYIDEDEKLHDCAVVKEMDGKCEDLLGARGPLLPRLNNILGRSLVSIGSIVDRLQMRKILEELSADDRTIMLIALRRASLGDDYHMRVECPISDCKVVSHSKLDLSQLEIKKMKNPMKRVYESSLSKGKLVKWHIVTGRDEEWLSDVPKSLKKDNVFSLKLLSMVDEINGEKLDRTKVSSAVSFMQDNLSYGERSELRKVFEEYESDVDTKVEFKCGECGHEWEAELDIAQKGFFFP